MNAPAEGWYPDPQGPPGQQRWWTGSAWGEHVRQGGAGMAAPPSEPSALRGGFPWWGWTLLSIAALVVIVAVSSSNGGGPAGTSSGPALPPGAPAGAMAGALSKDCTIKCTSPDAADNLDVSSIYCAWNGGDVHVHATLTNGMNATVHLSIVPKYYLDKGGQHGTSFGSDIPITLAAHETKNWVGNAGQPEGVAPGLQITACAPRLEDIDIGS